MSCDLVNGRLLDECLLGRSGIKTLYFTKFNDFDSLTGVVEVDGEITDLGTDPITIYQFDMQKNVGNFEEIPASTPENGTIFLTQNVTLTLFFVKPADLENLNNLKRGRWTIWALDFQDKIRLFGRTRGMVASGGSDVSGAAPGDKKGLDLILTSFEQDYAPFMAAFTDTPFDNFTNVTIVSDDAFGPELLTTFVNGVSFPFSTFSYAAGVLTCIKPSQPAFEGCASNDLGAVLIGDIFRIEMFLTLNSGTAPDIALANTQDGFASVQSNQELLIAGANTFDLTRTTAFASCSLQINPKQSNVSDFVITVVSIKKSLL